MGYRDIASSIWRHHDLTEAAQDHLALIRYATMAASSHNTQPWRFRLEPGRVIIRPDLSRRCPEVDPDDHHLWMSLGCAAENLTEAAAAAGLQGHVSLEDGESGIIVDLEATSPSRSARFDGIPRRQCSRTEYDGSDPDPGELHCLVKAGRGEEVAVIMLTGENKKKSLLEYVMEGNARQIADAGWRAELARWIRFNGTRAARTGDGLYGGSMGSPDVPSWLGRIVLELALTPERQNRTDRTNIMSSQGAAIIVSERDDRAHWIEAGRCYQRFALTATSLGLQTAFANSPIEVAALRDELSSWLGVGEGRPDLIVRFGHGPEMPRSLRRPVADVIE